MWILTPLLRISPPNWGTVISVEFRSTLRVCLFLPLCERGAGAAFIFRFSREVRTKNGQTRNVDRNSTLIPNHPTLIGDSQPGSENSQPNFLFLLVVRQFCSTIRQCKKNIRRHGASTESRAHPPFLRRTYMTLSYIVVEGWGLKPLRTRRKSLTLWRTFITGPASYYLYTRYFTKVWRVIPQKIIYQYETAKNHRKLQNP